MSTLPRLSTILLSSFFLMMEKISESGEVFTMIFYSRLRVRVAMSFYHKHTSLLIPSVTAIINIRLFFAHIGRFWTAHFRTGKWTFSNYSIFIKSTPSSAELSFLRSSHRRVPLSCYNIFIINWKICRLLCLLLLSERPTSQFQSITQIIHFDKKLTEIHDSPYITFYELLSCWSLFWIDISAPIYYISNNLLSSRTGLSTVKLLRLLSFNSFSLMSAGSSLLYGIYPE